MADCGVQKGTNMIMCAAIEVGRVSNANGFLHSRGQFLAMLKVYSTQYKNIRIGWFSTITPSRT